MIWSFNGQIGLVGGIDSKRDKNISKASLRQEHKYFSLVCLSNLFGLLSELQSQVYVKAKFYDVYIKFNFPIKLIRVAVKMNTMLMEVSILLV